MKQVELLAPAGNLEKAKLAIDFGANAIFIGGKIYSLRARAANFDMPQIKEICEYAHSKNAKVYVAVNVICHNNLVPGFPKYIKQLEECNIDGIISADPYIIKTTKDTTSVDVHISTQQSVTNSKAALFWKKQGSTRAVLAREVDKDELKKIITNLKGEIEIEHFIHGAVCISYSGRCMMSNNFSFRDANVGGCAHSCRWKFDVIDKDNNKADDTKFTMSAKDNSLIREIPEMIDIGIDSFKIEGRMKSLHYVGTVVNAYRKAIDQYYESKNKVVNSDLVHEINKAAHRDTGTSWYNSNPGPDQMLYHDEEKVVKQDFAFQVAKEIEPKKYLIIARNYFEKKMDFEIFGPNKNSEIRRIKILSIKDQENNEYDISRTPMKKLIIETDDLMYENDIGRIHH